MENYVGKIVFVENIGTGQNKSNYYNGEYIIVKQSPNNLYGVSTKGGYNSHELKTFSLIGDNAFNVLSVEENDNYIYRLYNDLKDFSEEGKTPEKRQWIEYVYTNCASNAKMILKAIEEKNSVNITDKNDKIINIIKNMYPEVIGIEIEINSVQKIKIM